MPAYQFHTKPFDHQRRCFKASCDLPYFAYLMEQGTGKSKVGIDTAAYLYERQKIQALLVIAPNEGDVPDNWLDQINEHLPKRIKRAVVRAKSSMRVKVKARFKSIIESDAELGLRIITINIEAVRASTPLFDALLKFVRRFETLLIVDESTRIKSPSAAQTKGCLKLGANVPYRRIATGTPITNGPFDAYSQFLFLHPTILGFDSYTAYKAHYCQMLPPEHGLIRYAADKRTNGAVSRLSESISREPDPYLRQEMILKQRKLISIVQIPARDPSGQVIYRNQDRLAKAIAPHSFRVLKDECLDLPPKLYERRYVDLTPGQRTIYDLVKKKVIAEFVKDQELKRMTISLAILRLLRLQQVVGNYYSEDPDPDTPRQPPKPIEINTLDKRGKLTIHNPRIDAMLAIIDEARPETKIIIWCRFVAEIAEIVKVLELRYGAKTVGQLHGQVKGDERVRMRKRFQDLKDPMRFLVGQLRSGIGIDLFAAGVEVYYSNSFSLEQRLQSEDRAHRIGLKHKLTIYDIEARDTLDRRIIETLRAKKSLSDVIVGDSPINWI